jgi:rhamnosyltransferase
LKSISKVFPKKGADICAVFTAFRPDEFFSERVERVCAQVGFGIIVIDGGGALNDPAQLKFAFQSNSKILVHWLAENQGIAAALNAGVSIAKKHGYRWILTMDDDTMAEPDMVENLVYFWRRIFEQEGFSIAIMGMLSVDKNTGSVEKVTGCGDKFFVEKRGIITSGSLIALDAYDALGPFREEFFIDSVDYDFCMRARSRGYRVIKLCLVGMIHSLGRTKEFNFGLFKVKTTNHSTVRRYYMYRNSTILAREYFLSDPLYSFAVFIFQLKTWLIVLFLEKDKGMKLKNMLRGIFDGWRKRMGKTISNH